MEDDDESRAFSAPSPLCSPPDSPESNAQEMEIPSTPPTRVAARSSGILNSAFERAMDRRDLVLIETFGASGVQVAWEETPQALQTGIASGYFNPPLAPVLFGHGAYLKYFTDLRVAPAHRLICGQH